MFPAITALTTGIELVTELLSAAVLLLALDKLATAIRWTYAAGKLTGRLWFRWGLPALLWTADAISWAVSKVDWVQVRSTVLTCLKTLTALAITAALVLRDAHRRWVGTIDWTVPTQPAPPAVNPLFTVADELSTLSCKQLRSLTGSRRRCRKAELIGGWLAC